MEEEDAKLEQSNPSNAIEGVADEPSSASAGKTQPAMNDLNNAESSRNYWSLQESLILIEAMKQEHIEGLEAEAKGPSKTAKDKFDDIVKALARAGIVKSALKCKNRWHYLLRDYRKIKDFKISDRPSYYSMSMDTRKEYGLPSKLDKQIFEALDSWMARDAITGPLLIVDNGDVRRHVQKEQDAHVEMGNGQVEHAQIEERVATAENGTRRKRKRARERRVPEREEDVAAESASTQNAIIQLLNDIRKDARIFHRENLESHEAFRRVISEVSSQLLDMSDRIVQVAFGLQETLNRRTGET